MGVLTAELEVWGLTLSESVVLEAEGVSSSCRSLGELR